MSAACSTSSRTSFSGPVRHFLIPKRCPAAAAVPRAVDIRFAIPYRVQFGQSLSVVGSSSLLGDWNVDRRVAMQWTDGDVWCAEVQAPGSDCALEYKYVIVEKDGHVSSWKPGGNLEIRVESFSGAVAVRDDWDGEVHEINLEHAAPSTPPHIPATTPPAAASSAASEEDAVLDALQRAYLELESALQLSLQLAEEADDPADPRLLINDQKLAAASRRAVSLSKALEAGAPPPAYILKNLERELES